MKYEELKTTVSDFIEAAEKGSRDSAALHEGQRLAEVLLAHRCNHFDEVVDALKDVVDDLFPDQAARVRDTLAKVDEVEL